MAKSGAASSVTVRDDSRSAGTRAKLVAAAIATLQADGFAGSSARAIAERAGVNQGLIFYHFGSVANLLLAALDWVSARRMEHYGAAVERVETPTELVEVATDIFSEDLDAGYVAVLVEMIAGASSTPGLGPEVSARDVDDYLTAVRSDTGRRQQPAEESALVGTVMPGSVKRVDTTRITGASRALRNTGTFRVDTGAVPRTTGSFRGASDSTLLGRPYLPDDDRPYPPGR